MAHPQKQACTKCQKLFPATTSFFRKSKTHRLGLHKECISWSDTRTSENVKKAREKGLHSLQMGGSYERQWLVCSRLCLGQITRELVKANRNTWDWRVSTISDNLRNSNRLYETSNIKLKRLKWDLKGSMSEQWETCFRTYVQTLIWTKNNTNSMGAWGKKFHSIYKSD